MTDELILFTHPHSRGATIHWMLEEIGCPYRLDVKQFGPEMKSPEYLAINPMGKVPALRHGNTVVTESAAILCYLADLFPEAKLAPPPGERGAYYRWLFFGAGPLEASVTNKALGVEVPDERKGMVGYGDFGRVMDTLDAALSRSSYIAGDRFTAADVYVGSQITFGLRFGSIEDRPAFRAYRDRLADRPAAARAEALDNAAMPKREA